MPMHLGQSARQSMSSMMGPMSPAPPAADMSGLFKAMLGLAERPQETPADKVKRAIDILDEVRDMDPKIGANVSMAMHILKNGPDGLEKFTSGSSQSSKY